MTRKKDPRPQSKAPSGLTKADLIDVVYQRHGALTRTEAAEVVDKIFATVKTSLGGGRPVRIKNFGTFEVMPRAGRVGVDPSSGDRIFIPPHNGLSFRPARRLKSEVTRKASPRRRDDLEG
ncbi:MAG: HU family DNA-binding protein [Acidobacteriota bacterium]